MTLRILDLAARLGLVRDNNAPSKPARVGAFPEKTAGEKRARLRVMQDRAAEIERGKRLAQEAADEYRRSGQYRKRSGNNTPPEAA